MNGIEADLRLDPSHATPLYLQLAARLVDAIDGGQWQTGQALPSERALAQRVNVSRITARKALDRLVARGLIRRARGSGTFVAPRVDPSLSRLTSFTELLIQRGHRPSSRWLHRESGHATAEECARLDLAADTAVCRLKRLRLADDVVVAVEETSLPSCVLDEPQAVTHSLYATLASRGTPIVRARQHISAINAWPSLARLAEVEPQQALLMMTRIGYLADGRAGELTVTYCRTDYYDFQVELAP
ncbi:GntR family transcriptional regulator [Salinicola aestuarinus]|uniref:GntR family transcriptional regulator n=1 Tax=Salinicola aestuarinus TaxID=1949082 RepID=UPI000DA1A564|nr:GntR family transcriptional regulator [Salinicola aestuarinus]